MESRLNSKASYVDTPRALRIGGRGVWVEGGFTITEILLVVTVIAVIIILSSAVFKGSSEQNKNVKCLTNLRTIQVGLANYLADKGYYPGYRVNTNPTYWIQALVPYIEGTPVPAASATPRPWMQCPARAKDTIGYGYNSYFGHVPPNASDFSPAFADYWNLRPQRVLSPSKTVVIGDNKDSSVTNSFSPYQISRTANETNVNYPRRHFEGGNFLFADGHIERLTPKEQAYRATKENLYTPF